jgi:threonine dehydrogenase-like Zn-dependent dehydrogenase
LGYHDEDWEHGRVEYPPVSVRWSTRQNIRLMLQLMAENRLRVDVMTTHRFPLPRIDEAVSAHLDAPGLTLGTLLMMEDNTD